MNEATTLRKALEESVAPPAGGIGDLSIFLPKELLCLDNPQTDIPRIAKDLALTHKTETSTPPIRPCQPLFKVFPELQDASYAKRYEILLTRLVRERLYDSTCFLLLDQETGRRGQYREPSAELGFGNFAESLVAKAMAHVKMAPPPASGDG